MKKKAVAALLVVAVCAQGPLNDVLSVLASKSECSTFWEYVNVCGSMFWTGDGA